VSPRRTLWTVAAVIAAVNLVALALAALDRSAVVAGPAGSATVTTALGTAALVETLQTLGADVRVLRERVDDQQLDEASTFVVVEPGLAGYGDGELAALRRFVETGGRIVLAGRPDASLVEALVPGAPAWNGTGSAEQRVWAPPAWGTPATVLEGGGIGSWDGNGVGMAMAGWEDGTTAHAVTVGEGLVVLVSDAGPFTNERIDRADNAAWVVSLLGPGPIVFDEFRHGAGQDGAALLPPSWSRALPLLAVALVVALVTYGRRTEPIRPPASEAAPERLRFVEGLAGSLRRTRNPGAAVEPTRRAALDLLEERAGPLASADRVRAAGSEAGLTPRQTEALAAGARDHTDAIEIDRALAALRSRP
jgi:hypothetical protein